MKRFLLAVILLSLLATGCTGTKIVPTKTSQIKYIVETDCK
jgi:hypothetical protein